MTQRRFRKCDVWIANDTDYSARFIRRLLKWCMQRMDVGSLARAYFAKTSRAYCGRYFPSRETISVKIGDANKFPMAVKYPHLKTAPAYRFEDQLEALVGVCLHECWHRRQHELGLKFSEIQAERRTLGALEDFRRERVTLTYYWELAPPVRPATPVSTPEIWPGISKALESVEPIPMGALREAAESILLTCRAKLRLERNQALLKRWQRKLKLATTKVRKLKASIKRGESYLNQKWKRTGHESQADAERDDR